MAYFDNGNYNFDDLFNELNRDFFNDGRMTNGQQPMRYSTCLLYTSYAADEMHIV